MACPRKLFFHRAALEVAILILIHSPLSTSLATRSALPKTPPRPSFTSPDWRQDDFWNRFQKKDSKNPGYSPEDGLLDVLKRIVSYKPLTMNEQLAPDVDKLSEEIRIFLFHQQGVPNLAHNPIGRILQPVFWIPRRHGVHHLQKERAPYLHHHHHLNLNHNHNHHHRLNVGQNGLKDQGRDGYYLPRDAVPVRKPLTLFPVNVPTPPNTVAYKNHAYSPDPEEDETLSKVIDQLTRNADFPGVNPQINVIPVEDLSQSFKPVLEEFRQPLKPVTYSVPPQTSLHPSRYPAGHVPSKPTTNPSYKDLLKLENTLKQFLFSPQQLRGKEATSKSSPAQIFHPGSNDQQQKVSSSLPTGQPSGFVAPLRPGDERGQPFRDAQDGHFQGGGDLGFGQLVRDRERTGQEDLRKEEKEQEEEQQEQEMETEEEMEENVVPDSSSSFSMSFGSFVHDDKDCDNILTKACEDDTGCQCFGFYQCVNGRCRENARSPVAFDPDGAGLAGQWHEGPAQALGRHGKP